MLVLSNARVSGSGPERSVVADAAAICARLTSDPRAVGVDAAAWAGSSESGRTVSLSAGSSSSGDAIVLLVGGALFSAGSSSGPVVTAVAVGNETTAVCAGTTAMVVSVVGMASVPVAETLVGKLSSSVVTPASESPDVIGSVAIDSDTSVVSISSIAILVEGTANASEIPEVLSAFSVSRPSPRVDILSTLDAEAVEIGRTDVSVTVGNERSPVPFWTSSVSAAVMEVVSGPAATAVRGGEAAAVESVSNTASETEARLVETSSSGPLSVRTGSESDGAASEVSLARVGSHVVAESSSEKCTVELIAPVLVGMTSAVSGEVGAVCSLSSASF